jgi:hypothetical protein
MYIEEKEEEEEEKKIEYEPRKMRSKQEKVYVTLLIKY